MPFDTEVHTDLVFAPAADLAAAFDNAQAPDMAWTAANPDRALTFLFVSPQPCAALDALLAA